MHLDNNLLDFIAGNPNEITDPVLKELMQYVVYLFVQYNKEKKNGDIIVYEEDRLLESLGYQLDDIAILRDLILEVTEVMNRKGEEKAIKLVKDKNSYIYVELACFEYEIGLNKLRNELDRIHSSRDKNKIDIDIYHRIFGENYQHDVYDAIISISQYIHRGKKKQSEEKEDVSNKKRSIKTLKIENRKKVVALVSTI